MATAKEFSYFEERVLEDAAKVAVMSDVDTFAEWLSVQCMESSFAPTQKHDCGAMGFNSVPELIAILFHPDAAYSHDQRLDAADQITKIYLAGENARLDQFISERGPEIVAGLRDERGAA